MLTFTHNPTSISPSLQLIPESEKDSTVHGTQCLAFQTDRGICIRVRIKISPDVAHLNKKMSLLCGLHYTVEENTMSPQRNYSNNGGGFGRSGSSASDSDGRPSMNSNSDRDRDSDATSSIFNSHHSHAGRMSMSSPPGVREYVNIRKSQSSSIMLFNNHHTNNVLSLSFNIYRYAVRTVICQIQRNRGCGCCWSTIASAPRAFLRERHCPLRSKSSDPSVLKCR